MAFCRGSRTAGGVSGRTAAVSLACGATPGYSPECSCSRTFIRTSCSARSSMASNAESPSRFGESGSRSGVSIERICISRPSGLGSTSRALPPRDESSSGAVSGASESLLLFVRSAMDVSEAEAVPGFEWMTQLVLTPSEQPRRVAHFFGRAMTADALLFVSGSGPAGKPFCCRM
jgi:hypothetical protein